MVPWYALAPTSTRLDGRWRYARRSGRGIALSYDHGAPAPAPPAAVAEPATPAAPDVGDGVRVLCYCGTSFSFEGDAGVCPHCAQLAEWPTTGLVEREMRADLDAVLAPHERAD